VIQGDNAVVLTVACLSALGALLARACAVPESFVDRRACHFHEIKLTITT
jgi:hypothetical protein